MRKQNLGHWDPFRNLLGMIRLILIVDWDPIGVFGHPSTLDEYDGYATRILSMLTEDSTVEDIAACLLKFETVEMGLSNPTLDNRRRFVAAKILDATLECDE